MRVFAMIRVRTGSGIGLMLGVRINVWPQRRLRAFPEAAQRKLLSHVAQTAAASVRFNATPPTSDLCVIVRESSFRTAGTPFVPPAPPLAT
jgi:hypothetical protein